jgi:enoyl-[acyl-carrier protein] reductase I
MDTMQLAGKTILVCGVANRRSVAYHTGQFLQQAGADVIYSVRSEERRESVRDLLGTAPVLVCDVEYPEQIDQLARQVAEQVPQLDGLLHSIAFAEFGDGPVPFHETGTEDFLRAVNVSCFSLVTLSNAFKQCLAEDASVVTISISSTRMAAENYGYMAPVKAALDSSMAMLAKSFSRFSRVRFNAVAAGLLRTSASAGIPGYVDSYLFAEQVIPRKEGLRNEEVAQVAAFLLSPLASGINAQSVVVDAGMSVNYFDQEIVRRALSDEP